jgi:hypothetical protein
VAEPGVLAQLRVEDAVEQLDDADEADPRRQLVVGHASRTHAATVAPND